ncbi:hypothetical protein C4L14_21170 [Enterobacter sp. RC4]|nr:hypothetical protein C4L14_21170 [Enterobacter sp. RC4]
MGSCAAPSAKGDDKFITTDYLQQCHRVCMEEKKTKFRPNASGALSLNIDTDTEAPRDDRGASVCVFN